MILNFEIYQTVIYDTTLKNTCAFIVAKFSQLTLVKLGLLFNSISTGLYKFVLKISRYLLYDLALILVAIKFHVHVL